MLDGAKCAQESPNATIVGTLCSMHFELSYAGQFCHSQSREIFDNHYHQFTNHEWKIGNKIRQHHHVMPTWLYYSILLLIYEPSKCCNEANISEHNLVLQLAFPSSHQ
jgi:hypothetical protein